MNSTQFTRLLARLVVVVLVVSSLIALADFLVNQVFQLFFGGRFNFGKVIFGVLRCLIPVGVAAVIHVLGETIARFLGTDSRGGQPAPPPVAAAVAPPPIYAEARSGPAHAHVSTHWARLVLHTAGATVDSRDLKWGVTTVGRGPDNGVVIDHPSISSRHCEFELGADSLIVRDRGSTNGTYVNGARITEARLDPGQKIRLGDVQMQAEWSRDKVAAPAISAPKQKASVNLGAGVWSCFNHEKSVSTWYCATCAKYLCNACTRDVRLQGQASNWRCAECSGALQPITWPPPPAPAAAA